MEPHHRAIIGGDRREQGLPVTSALFDAVAGNYGATRPTYPDVLYREVEQASGRTFATLKVLDVGAGTGIATRALRDLGADVTAVDPGRGMLAELAQAFPGLPCVAGDGNALPIRDAAVDLVTYAQALHWTDLSRSIPEARRVLRPGGLLAAWWNVPDLGVSWISEQAARLRAAAPLYHGFAGADLAPKLAGPPFHMRVETRTFAWRRGVPLELHVGMLATLSYVAALDAPRREALLADERAELARVFPDGTVTEHYVARLTLAWLDQAPGPPSAGVADHIVRP